MANKSERKRRMKRAQRRVLSSHGLHWETLAAPHSEPPSAIWRPMVRDETYQQLHPTYNRPEEFWENWRYHANCVRFESGFPIGGGPWSVIGISANSQAAVHDWRDYQRIKNDIVGDEWEAVELYPAESRLVDPSNRFYLWCVPKGAFTFGYDHRRVWDAGHVLAPQRPFGKKESHAHQS